MQNSSLKWIYLIVLSVIWGSSFILIKKGLVGLTPLQLGALRILFSAAVLGIAGWKSLKTIKKQEWKWVLISGILGTGIPVFLFAYAETEIDSAIAAILNSSVPLLAFIFGILFFGARFIKQQFLGVLLGLAGAVALILIGARVNPDQNYYYALLVIAAACLYAINVNIIKRHLQDVSAMAIALGNFLFLIIPALGILFSTDFFELPLGTDSTLQTSIGYILILSIFGTAAAKVMFNKLVQISDPVFASSVTYLMPIVSVTWGLLDGEIFTFLQFLAALIIITGVYLGNRSKKARS
ncbi:DMT family transporter [Dokdonia sinensis]|uniref:DMT family transporter n=1 Tax=Dokdonia sinensis TaxID=2479847 RepID=A0A3M0FUV0_9FLAO|nr:DMT family transporter [Dokdonia sinensis]RMB56431.1 DMT family transporter [Dokdonia sinensis]